MKKKFVIVTLIILHSTILFAQAKEEVRKEYVKGAKAAESLDLEKSFFKNDTLVGVIGATGNTESLSVTGSNYTQYRYKRFENQWKFAAYYFRVFSSRDDDQTTGTIAKYIFGVYRFDYYILPRFTYFVGGGGYTDEVKGIELAGQGFTGFRYFFIRNERQKLSTSVGYNYTYEDRQPPDGTKQIHSAMIELAYNIKLNSRVEFTENVTLLQSVRHGRDVRVNNDTELRVKMTDHLALALGFNLRFDNRPVTNFKKLDTMTNLSLAVTF